MWDLRWARTFIRDIITPLSGIVLVFYLASQPNERPSYFLGAIGLIGTPVALAARDAARKHPPKPDEEAE